ncbi:MAG: cyclic nucleotide-binding domain-containing protein [Leptonema sp. (in: bacteria)]
MPTIKEYTKGAIIYFEGDKSDFIYLLQSGQVVLIYSSLDGTKEEKYLVKTGEFFGVKSSLGNYPREETAQVLGKARVILLKLDEFRKIALENTRLVLQMSRVFSNELREIHSKIREILKVDSIKDLEFELMNVGESFYIAGNIQHAEYVFEKYLVYYPTGKFKERAELLLRKTRKGDMYPIDIPSLEDYAKKLYDSYEDESFVKETLSPVDKDLFQLPDEEGPSLEMEIQNITVPNLKERINHLINNNQVKEAYDLLLESENIREFATDKEFLDFFHFEKGRLLILLKNYKAGLEQILNYLKNYPQGKYLKNALFQAALTFELLKNEEKASMFYKKVLLLKPEDEITKQAKQRLAALSKL